MEYTFVYQLGYWDAWMGMNIDRRLMLLGVMLVVLSMTMATQYAVTRVSYSYAIVHPSNADIRFVGSDNSSDDGIRVLRVTTNTSTNQYLTIELGDWFPGSEKNYSAAFAIINEEPFAVNLTYINVSGGGASYMSIWLHGDRDRDVSLDSGTKVRAVTNGTANYNANNIIWKMSAGDGNIETMDGATYTTVWDTQADVKFSLYDTNAANGTKDFVWVQISLNIPQNAALIPAATGQLWIHFEAVTH